LEKHAEEQIKFHSPKSDKQNKFMKESRCKKCQEHGTILAATELGDVVVTIGLIPTGYVCVQPSFYLDALQKYMASHPFMYRQVPFTPKFIERHGVPVSPPPAIPS
jgi:hypothetical protein